VVPEPPPTPAHGRPVDVWAPDDFARGPHAAGRTTVHLGHALSWIVAGDAEVDLGHAARVQAGDFVLVPAGVPHRGGAGDAATRWGVQFCPGCLGFADGDGLLDPFMRVRHGGSPVVRAGVARGPWVVDLLTRLRDAARRTDPAGPVVTQALLTLLLDEVRQAAGEPARTAPTTRVARALAHVWRHALGPLSLRDVAAAVGCSPGHLATEVKRGTGLTVGQWIRASRVAAAEGWLLHSDASMDEIAARVGWKDTTHFIRQFKAATGLTPARWRRRAR
jgi:AraC-like DNA-binding protein